MAESKKFISLVSIALVILSNLAFAQYDDPSSYEGRPIDPSREGIDYYREGDVIVYPAKMDSERKMMQKFSSGEMNEEEMRRMAKEKFGDKFDEMEFKKGMMEFKERMGRKDAFSYEHEGYGKRYDTGPSYEGYSKEHMIFGMIFEHIGDDIDPREIKQYCNEPEKIADIVVSKLKEKLGDLQKVCSRFDDMGSKCEENAKKSCSRIGTPFVREDANEMEKINAIAYSCPVNKDAIVEACRKRSKFQIEQRIKNADEECRKRFDFEGERLLRECERFSQNQVCDREKYMERCMGHSRREEPGVDRGRGPGFGEAKWECHDGSVESQSDSSCRASEAWEQMARKSCEGRCSKETGKCGVNSFSVGRECKPEQRACPDYPVPQCEDNSVLRSRADAKGCNYHYCETTQTVCPRDVKQCPDGSYVSRSGPHCEFAPCPEAKCPEPVTPACAAGTHLEKNVDERGCVNYYCKQDECPQVAKPTCAAEERLETFYDNRGCVSSYQCVKYQAPCPTVSKPTCAEGQQMTTRYDDKGCVTGYECVTVTTSNGSSISGYATFSNENMKEHCEKSWNNQQRMCSESQNVCDKESFIQKCKEHEKKNFDDSTARMERHCSSETMPEIRHAEQRCERLDEDRKRCLEQSAKRCGQQTGLAGKCKEFMTEENLRKFIIEEARKKCKFTDIIEDEEDVRKADKVEIVLAVLNTARGDDLAKLKLFIDNLKEDLKLQDTTIYKGMISPSSFGDVKLMPFVVNAKISATVSSKRAKEVKAKIVAGTRAGEAASKLVSLRDSDVPNEYLYIIEDKASDVLDVADKLEEAEKKDEQKGIGYKIKLFLGLAKAAEQEEIKQLDESKAKLQNSIDTLAKLADEVPSDVAKAILKEQVENLKKQKVEIEVLIETKEKKAKGLFGVFG